jgi:hypothetical protein
MYKRLVIAGRISAGKHDLAIAHAAFYPGAQGALRVLAYLIEHGEDEDLRRTIERHGRQIRAIRGCGLDDLQLLEQLEEINPQKLRG